MGGRAGRSAATKCCPPRGFCSRSLGSFARGKCIFILIFKLYRKNSSRFFRHTWQRIHELTCPQAQCSLSPARNRKHSQFPASSTKVASTSLTVQHPCLKPSLNPELPSSPPPSPPLPFHSFPRTFKFHGTLQGAGMTVCKRKEQLCKSQQHFPPGYIPGKPGMGQKLQEVGAEHITQGMPLQSSSSWTPRPILVSSSVASTLLFFVPYSQSVGIWAAGPTQHHSHQLHHQTADGAGERISL